MWVIYKTKYNNQLWKYPIFGVIFPYQQMTDKVIKLNPKDWNPHICIHVLYYDANVSFL